MRVLLTLVCLFALPLRAAAEPEEDSSRYFPLSEGREWEYSLVKDRVTREPGEHKMLKIKGTVTETVVGPSLLLERRPPAYQLKVVLHETVGDLGVEFDATYLQHVSADGTYVLLHALQPVVEGQEAPPKPKVDELGAVVYQLVEPPDSVDGYHRVTVLGTEFDLRTTDDRLDAVQTPAGSFDGCLKIVQKGDVRGTVPGDRPMKIINGTLERTSWFAPGVGLVRQTHVMELVVERSAEDFVHISDELDKTLVRYTAPQP